MKALTIFGTRPEQLKLAPVVAALRELDWEVAEASTGQSANFVQATDCMKQAWAKGMAQGLAHSLGVPCIGFDVVLVAGDTASAFAGAVAGFLAEVPVAHVEAGLRTYERDPWPEEQFRRAIAAFATYHFCPDGEARRNILQEMGIPEGGIIPDGVYITGNTIIDTLPKRPLKILATMHRREHWGTTIQSIITTLANADAKVRMIRHPNWGKQYLEPKDDSITFLDPMPHYDFLQEMPAADIVITDSGGLQEEAAYLGVPCWCVRASTERSGLLRAGSVELVWPPETLAARIRQELDKRTVYGAGDAGQKIAKILTEEFADA